MAFPLIGALMNGLRLGATGLGILGGAPVGAARAGAGALNLLKQAYTPNAMGLMNLGMDAIPLAMDIANNDVGLKSFSSFGGTMIGTKFGGRELNKVGEKEFKRIERNAVNKYNEGAFYNPKQMGLPSTRNLGNTTGYQYGETGNSFLKMNPDRDKWIDERMGEVKDRMYKDNKYSKQGYNMGAGFAADAGLYSLTAGMNKPKPTDFETQMLQGQSSSPVTRYMQMTGGL
tara:strand:- start:5660 stop:6349 length:690 start_codon:yes stop_codon:yes gene_type:complete